MTQVTVEEPRSVIEEVEKYECDNCSEIIGEENAHFVEMWPANRDTKPNNLSELRTADLCDNCIEADSYISYMDLVEKRESRMSMIASGLNKSLYVIPTAATISFSIHAAFFPTLIDLGTVGNTLIALISIFPVTFLVLVFILSVISKWTAVIQE